MITNSDWLNLTANKQPGGPPWHYFIVHETASPNPDNPDGTLNYNLPASVGSSYHDLIGRDGVRYRYLDAERYIAWHAGVNTRVWVDGIMYEGGEVNSYAIGIELDGANDGTPATTAQLNAMADLLNEYGDRYGIPRDSNHLIMHSEAVAAIDPSYKSDARCTTIDELVTLCAERAADPLASYERLYRVKFFNSTIRQGPSRSFPIVATVHAGLTFLSDSAKWGQTIEGSDEWIHAASGIGFIHSSAVERMDT